MVRWGFLGAGVIATHALAPAVHAAEGAELYAVAARDVERARALGPTGPVHGSYEQLLAEPDVDAVYVALNNDAHAPWTVAALRAGKHVLCEKPLGLSAAEVDAMEDAAREAGRLLVEASMYRWHPRVQLAQRLLAEGAIGAVRHVAAGFTLPGISPGFRLETARGGGALYDIGCYTVSAALWAFGGAPVEDVDARLRLGPTGIDLAADVILRVDGGDAELHVAIDEPGGQWLVITGDQGELELRDQPFTAWREMATELWHSDGRTTERIPVAAADHYRLMVEAVSAAIRDEPAYVVPLDQSRATAAVIDAAFAAARTP